MYEDLSTEHLKKGDGDEDSDDSGSWSYSYPAYSRFTFTGKSKSRLGKSHSRQSQPTANRDNPLRTKGNHGNTNSTDIDSYKFGLNSQVPKTPGMSWLQKDKLPSSNSFTPGSNLFRPTVVHDAQMSSNDSGLDASIQSNFLFSLKNDSIQNSSCKRNLAFNTPFKFEENRQESSLKELKQLLHESPFPKLKFTNEKIDENKENTIIEQNSCQVPAKESVALDLFKNKSNQISGNDCKQISPAASDDNVLKSINNKKLSNESNNPTCATNFCDKKIEDDSSNTPMDLSSGKCLTYENIFSRSFLSEREQNLEQPKEDTKEITNKNDVSLKEKCSSDGLSSILPTFLAPVNKRNSNEVATTTSNELCGASVNLEKAAVNCLPVSQNEMPKPTQQVRNGVSSWVSASHMGNNSLGSSAGEPKPIFNNGHIVQSNMSTKESHTSNLLRKTNETVKYHKDQNESAASKNYDQLSAIVNLSKCGSNEAFNSLVSSTVSKPKTDPHFQPLDHLSESNVMKPANTLKSNNEFISKHHVAEDRLKNLSANYKTNEDCKNVPIATMNSAVSIISCPVVPNDRNVRSTNNLNVNPKSLIPSSLNLQENILSLKKSSGQSHESQLQLSQDCQSQDCSAKTTERQESVNHKVAKGSRLPPHDPLVLINQDNLLLPNGPMQSLQQEPEIVQQKTFLAPRQSSDHRISHNFPHVKPDAPQLMNHALKKPQNFKMSAPRGLMSRSNTELYVNGKVYTTLSMLGRGGSSEVYQVLDQRSSKLMAVKCVDLSMVDKTIAEGYLNEIDLLSKLQGCSSVIRMFDYEYVQEYKMLYVVMEKGDTDLSQLIRDISKTKKISMSMIIYYWTEMLTAVRDIHEKGIIHSDLKPANFLLVSGRLKLIDFGIASSQGDMTSVFKEVTTGTWNYMSPEAIKNTSASAKGFKITYKSDVWSLGCILYNLLYGKTPFSHITSTWSKLQAIADPNHQVEFPEVGAPLVLAEALQSCLRREPKMRPTVAELLALPYHASGDSRHLAPKLRSILPHEWWSKISRLFQEVKVDEEDKGRTGVTS